MSQRNNWTEEETILAFYLYCQIPFGQIHQHNPRIIELAELLGRSPGSVGLKLSNLAACDPEQQKRNIKGMSHHSKLEPLIIEEFSNDWETLTVKAKEIEAKLKGKPIEDIIEEPTLFPEGRTEERTVQQRINQQFFRDAVLSAYQGRCCITGLQVPELLIASHIKPWAVSDSKTERTDPRNGLCLNGLHDKAFDRGLITVLPDYTIKISTALKEAPSTDGNDWLRQCEGQKIILPTRFKPTKEYLEYHNDVIFLR